MVFDQQQLKAFQTGLLDWYFRAKRDLPWRHTRDPYAVWLSEIMLQQTRVAAAIPYYEKFLKRFPDIESLAAAPEDDLLAHWAGLGYYYRARNLQKAAQQMVRAGGFAQTYEAIRELPGVGDYTAAAVASISFSLPHAVLDGNVFRVISRIAKDTTDISSTAGKKHFTILAGELLARESPGEFNQAMMELGATICLPKNPQCLICPVAVFCEARKAGGPDRFPVKTKKQTATAVERTVYWVEANQKLLLWQRPAHARLMPGFWELPEKEQVPSVEIEGILGHFRHGITVYNYRFTVARGVLPVEGCGIEDGTCQWIAEDDLSRLPLSTIAKKAWRVVRKSRLEASAVAAAG